MYIQELVKAGAGRARGVRPTDWNHVGMECGRAPRAPTTLFDTGVQAITIEAYETSTFSILEFDSVWSGPATARHREHCAGFTC